MLLKDDNERLVSVGLDGREEVLWKHPGSDVYGLAASPDGDSLALVTAPFGTGPDDSNAYLYLLSPDGSVRLVFATYDNESIITPVFIRPPTDPEGPVRLYWLVLSEADFDAGTGSPVMTMMTLTDDGPEEVEVPLRWGQSPFKLFAYPGGPTSVLTIFRKSDMPTRHAYVRNADWWETPDLASPTRLGYWEDVANTDVATGVTFLTPDTYVAAVGGEEEYPIWELQRFKVNCEWAQPEVVYRGPALDTGYSDSIWRLLALDEHRVLVIGRIDAIRVSNAGRRMHSLSVPWRVLDTRTGRIHTTKAMWDQDWAWTVVRPAREFPDDGAAHCED